MYLTHFDSVANSDQRKIPTSFERINTKIKMECEDADGSVNPDQDADLDRDGIHRDGSGSRAIFLFFRHPNVMKF
jgi:hypothetical protein